MHELTLTTYRLLEPIECFTDLASSFEIEISSNAFLAFENTVFDINDFSDLG